VTTVYKTAASDCRPLEPLLTRQVHPSYPRVVIADHSVMNRMVSAQWRSMVTFLQRLHGPLHLVLNLAAKIESHCGLGRTFYCALFWDSASRKLRIKATVSAGRSSINQCPDPLTTAS